MRKRIEFLQKLGMDPMTAQDRAVLEVRERVMIAQTIDDLKQIMLFMLEV